MASMHAICHRKDGRPENLTVIDGRNGLYGSGWWLLDDAQVEQIVGGLLYLHESSSEPSHFVARIEGVEWRNEKGRVELRVRRIRGLTDQAWRGSPASQSPKHYFKIVPATYDQEREALGELPSG